MSAVDTRMPRPEAIAIAKAFVAEIEEYTDQLIVAGSLRRRLARIGDIEVVAVAKVGSVAVTTSMDLFGGLPATEQRDLLDRRMGDLLAAGMVDKRLDVNGTPRWGATVKYLNFKGVRVDLFTCDAARFGWILMLRTGPAAFSRQLVVPKTLDNGRPGRTKDRRPGLMPAHLVAEGGWLRYRTSREPIETPTEESVFDLFKIPYIEPWSRI